MWRPDAVGRLDRRRKSSVRLHKRTREMDMALVEKPGNAEATSIVVETTPRVRKSHRKWTVHTFAPWLNSNAPVRVSGWAMLDPEHRAHLGHYRSTLWEVHPITKLEVLKDGHWVEADRSEERRVG